MQKLIEQLKRHEGFRAMPYRCTAGKLTIGYGRNIQDVPLTAGELQLIGAASQAEVIKNGITKESAEALLILEVQRLHKELAVHLPWFADLDEPRQAVLINMAFNLGLGGLLGFNTTLGLIKMGAYVAAAQQMMKTKWSKDVGDGPGGKWDRAEELAKQMEAGQW